jgi:hypothetical protein
MIYFNQPRADLAIYFLNESDKSQLTFQPAKNDSGKKTLTKIFFSQLFHHFRILNCNLSNRLKNLPTLFQKWFEYIRIKVNEVPFRTRNLGQHFFDISKKKYVNQSLVSLIIVYYILRERNA